MLPTLNYLYHIYTIYHIPYLYVQNIPNNIFLILSLLVRDSLDKNLIGSILLGGRVFDMTAFKTQLVRVLDNHI